MVRAVELNNGDIIQIKNTVLQYDSNLFYEVVENGLDEFMQTIWTRTGKVITGDQVNKL